MSKDKTAMTEQLANARRTALSHLPRIIASLSALWQAVLATKDKFVFSTNFIITVLITRIFFSTFIFPPFLANKQVVLLEIRES